MIHNYMGSNTLPGEEVFWFGDEPVTMLNETHKSLAHILVEVGKFKSVKDAKRNGFDKPVPNGWAVITIGKGVNRLDLYIWNPTECVFEGELPSCKPGSYVYIEE